MERQMILASQSPRRRELLAQAGFHYQVEPSQVIEKITKEKPWEVVMELSRQKAEDIYKKHMNKAEQAGSSPFEDVSILVIGADTVVAYGGMILGKPASMKDAFEMLGMLQGKTHQVYTGVTLVWNEKEQMHTHSFCEQTEVTFYPMTEQEISEYISTEDCMDKAGAYGIQTRFGIYIKEINGDYNNVVGLPIARLYQEMKRIGIKTY